MDKVKSIRIENLLDERYCDQCSQFMPFRGGGYLASSDHLRHPKIVCSWRCVQNALYFDLEEPEKKKEATCSEPTD